MSSTSSPSSSDSTPSSKEPSLGPACGFFFLLGASVISVAVIATSWYIGGSQGKQAAHALRSQLIPWVEKSSLSDPDRESILERLHELATSMDAEQLSERQLRRLSFRLSSAPIFQWGTVEEIQRQAHLLGELSEAEKEAIDREIDRLMRTTLDGKLGMEQLEFALQKVATVERLSGRLSAREGVTADEVREFLRRITSLSDRANTGREPLEKSPAQVFRIMIDEALKEPADGVEKAEQKP